MRVRSAQVQPARLLLLIHGWTGNEDSMWVFVRNLPADYWMLAPRAPHVTRPSGYSWRPMGSNPVAPPTLDDLRPSAQALIAMLDSYAAESGLTADQFSVLGFSQGAALTNTLALLYPKRIRRAGVLAGFVPVGAEKLTEQRPLEGVPFFVAHGTSDEMVQIEDARRSVELLERAGAVVTFCEDDVGHRVSAGCLRALQAFFA